MRASFHLRRRALTLTEVLVALAISLTFMTSVVAAYIQISRAASVSEARVQAHTRARNAIDQIAREVRFIRTDATLGNDQVFVLESHVLDRGDRIDNDGDGRTDEEFADGRDNDGDWVDRHGTLAYTGDRGDYLAAQDLGDEGVDEDTFLSRDILTFRLPAAPGVSTSAREITYRIGAFDGYNDVLLREELLDPGSFDEELTVEPVVFDVMSFSVLAWSPNDNAPSTVSPVRPYWTERFDAEAIRNSAVPIKPVDSPDGTPPFQFPAALWIEVMVNAADVPLADNGAWPLGDAPMLNVRLATTVTMETVISDVRYDMFVREQLKP